MTLARTQVGVMWTVSVLLAVVFLFVGGTLLLGGPRVVEGFKHFGYPGWFRFVIGILQVIGGVGLLIPRYAAIAASYLAIIMLGALISHVRAGDGFLGLLPALIVLFLVGTVIWLRGEE